VNQPLHPAHIGNRSKFLVLGDRGERHSTHSGQDHQTNHRRGPGRPDSAPPRTFRSRGLPPEIAQNRGGSSFAGGLDPRLNPFSGLGQQRLGLFLRVHDRLGRCRRDPIGLRLHLAIKLGEGCVQQDFVEDRRGKEGGGWAEPNPRFW
jgi:hypothetical protein